MSNIKPMIYRSKYCEEILCHDTYNGYEFVVKSYGSHPCAYIGIPKGHKFYKKNYSDVVFDELNNYIHFGLTYSQFGIHGLMTDKWVIGWDYSHYTDHSGFSEITMGKRWMTEEILEEVKVVIDEINKEVDND